MNALLGVGSRHKCVSKVITGAGRVVKASKRSFLMGFRTGHCTKRTRLRGVYGDKISEKRKNKQKLDTYFPFAVKPLYATLLDLMTVISRPYPVTCSLKAAA